MSEKAIFLDRDGTLIEDPGYINNPNQVKLLDGVPEALTQLKSMGYKLVVVSNQSGIARGLVSEKALRQIHDRLRRLLAQGDATLDKIYYCPFHPEGAVAKYRKESNLRKPRPGMLLTAAEEMDIDLTGSWVIGDSPRDVEAGLKAGCKTILLDNPARDKIPQPSDPKPHYRAVNIKEAVNIIKKYNRSSKEPESESEKVSAVKVPLQTKQEQNQPEAAELQTTSADKTLQPEAVEDLLAAILEQLRSSQRIEMFNEFSVMRMIAGTVQIGVLFCLLISIWFLMNPSTEDNSVLITLGFAAVLQVMALTFYLMQGRK